MLQQMRSAAKYIWIFLIVAFVGGFLLVETSGLLGRTPLTATTPVATVHGRDILYTDWYQRVQRQLESEQQRSGRSLTQDEVRQIEDGVLDQMVMEVLLQQEYRRRGITVTEEELREYAQFAPPDWLRASPELQTEGRFDPEKYRRLLGSAIARQQGLLAGLEQYYRSEIPRQKLFNQLASGLYVTDAELWRSYQDSHDSVQVSYVAFRPPANLPPDTTIPESELRRYFDAHKSEFERQGRAWLSVVAIPRTVSAADSAAIRARAEALRAEIAAGAKFEDVARRESADTISGANGGDLGRGTRGRFVPEFERAAYALEAGELSQPVLTPFGYHIIKVDEKKGDTLALRHILLRIQPSDSSAVRIDRLADQLAGLAAGSDQPAKLDTAAQRLKLQVMKLVAQEGEAAVFNGRVIPSVSAWAFGGARKGEISDLFDAEDGYYLARVDSIAPGGEPRFEAVRRDVVARVTYERALGRLSPQAEQLARAAAQSSLDAAARDRRLEVAQTPMFTRGANVPGLGQLTRATGAAFGLSVGAVSAPVRTDEAIFVMRVDRRVNADRKAWEAQRTVQRERQLQQLRQQVVQQFMQDLRRSAKVEDHRARINAAARRDAS
ncbi:MAG: peptidylprolyl isomerase [Gemmatimonadaceae bacterium]